MAEKKEAKKENTTLIAAAVIIVVLVAAAAFFSGALDGVLKPKQPPNKVSYEAEAIALVLKSYDAGAALTDYHLEYEKNDNGAVSKYGLAKKKDGAWVRVDDVAGAMEAFYGKNNQTDVVCLEYASQKKCAYTGVNGTIADISKNLKFMLPTKNSYLEQKKQFEDLAAVGAIRVTAPVEKENVGGRDAKKLTYVLDYGNVTVQTLISLGIQPNSPETYAKTYVTYWIDTASGLLIKSHAQQSGSAYYDIEFSKIDIGAPTLPNVSGAIVAPMTFLSFLKTSMDDYQVKAECLSLAPAEQSGCLKGLAVKNLNWDVCRLIQNKTDYESCTLMVAQQTNNEVLCGKLDYMADECYVAVASETGNYELCRLLKNQSMGSSCIAAASEGRKKAALRNSEAEEKSALKNCLKDSDCKTSGNAGQYCVAKNDTRQFVNETSELFACLKDVQCGCGGGYCGFEKNETYYACTSAVEENRLQTFLNNRIDDSNQTNKSK